MSKTQVAKNFLDNFFKESKIEKIKNYKNNMGKKAKEKRERRSFSQINKENCLAKREESRPFLVKFILFFTYLAFLTPLFISRNFYFPFVGPKALLFMAICQIIFFAWLFLILKHRQYRPKLNSILIAVGIFLLIITLSTLLSVDPSRSFWSKFERMTGLLMWLHLFAFILATSATFQKVADWKKLFLATTAVALIISVMAILEWAGVNSFKFSDRGGSTLGNTSFLGVYLLFNAFLALWLFGENRGKGWKIYSLTALFLMLITIYISEAKAATIATCGGFVLIFLLWLSFRPANKKVRMAGKIILVFSLLIVLVGLILLLVPHTFVQKKFVEMTGRARIVNWEIAGKAFQKKPLLGWGPETYDLTFNRFFNPCFFLEECGTEIWFDRSHNIVFDTLVTTGLLGFLAYLGIFISIFWELAKGYFKNSIDFLTFALIPSTLAAYFVQNLTVFDMPANLMLWGLVISFSAAISSRKEISASPQPLSGAKTTLAGIFLALVFCFTFTKFFLQPWQTDLAVIEALKAQTATKKIEIYQKVFNGSPLGKYQSVEFLAGKAEDIIKEQLNEIRQNKEAKELAEKELTMFINEIEKIVEKSPLDFRNVLRLAHLYNTYTLLDPSKTVLAEKYGKLAIELSPNNQQGYWVLAQTKAVMGKLDESLALAEKAIELEPKLFLAYQFAIQITQIMGRIDKAKEIAEKAVKINPLWEFQIKTEKTE